MKTIYLFLLIILICGCSITTVVNIGGSVNVIPVMKTQCGGSSNIIYSSTTADEANPASTTVSPNIPIK